MYETIHIVSDLSDKSMEEIKKDKNCGIVICTGPADSFEEQKNILALSNDMNVNIYTGIDNDVVKSVLEKLEDKLEELDPDALRKNSLKELEERTKGPDWIGEFDDNCKWFGDSDIGFRYTVIDIDLFKKLGLKVQGTMAIYIEYANVNMPESIAEYLLDMFVEKVCSTWDCVHLKDWRYKIIDIDDKCKGTFITNFGTLYEDGVMYTGPDKSYLFTFTFNLRNV